MKTNRFIQLIIPVLCFAVLTGSCEQKFKAEEPEIISFTHEPDPAVAGVYTIFSIEVDADYAVLWLGTETSDYDAYLAGPTPGNKGNNISLEYDKLNKVYTGSRGNNYKEPGTYKVVLVVTNVGDLGETLETKTQTINLVVQEPPEAR